MGNMVDVIPFKGECCFHLILYHIYHMTVSCNVTDLINRIVQVLKKDLYWVRISTQDAELIEPVKL